jgi:hypothetical protein
MKRMLIGLVLAFGVLTIADAHSASLAVPRNLPSKLQTPGWGNRAVTQATINSTICVVGWTATIRPPSTYTGYLKTAQLAYFGLPGTNADYEEDHFIPLELGGSAFDTRNLWPESWVGANISDPLENQLRQKVCAGQLTLAQARAQIRAYKWANG